MRNITLHLKDIIKFMDRAQNHVDSMDRESFLNDFKTGDAVIRCIEVIGEATKNVPESVRAQYPLIPWRDMAGMRDKLIHGYFAVDMENVWLAVTEDIPRLKPQIQEVLADVENSVQ